MFSSVILGYGLLVYIGLLFQAKANALKSDIVKNNVQEDRSSIESAANFYSNVAYGFVAVIGGISLLIGCLYRQIVTAARMIINSGKMTYQMPSILFVPFGVSIMAVSYSIYWVCVYSGIRASGTFEEKSASHGGLFASINLQGTLYY